jgi:hypothetical protein
MRRGNHSVLLFGAGDRVWAALGETLLTSARRKTNGAPRPGLRCERDALSRLANGDATLKDLERLEPLAELAGLPWRELYPELGT